MNRHTSRWSFDRTMRLRELFEEGLTFLEISHELGINRSAVAGKLHRLGLCRTQYSSKKGPPTVASKFGDWHKLGVFKYCKWLDEERRFCHEPVEKGSSYTFCPDHMKKVLSQTQRSRNDRKKKPILWNRLTSLH